MGNVCGKVWESLVGNLEGNSCGKILQEILVGKSCGKILREILQEIWWEMLCDIPHTYPEAVLEGNCQNM